MASRSRKRGSVSKAEEALTWNGADFAESGWTIQQSMIFAGKTESRPSGPFAILWAGNAVRTVDVFEVPLSGRIVLAFTDARVEGMQAVDLKLEPPGFQLGDGSHVSLLRTWNDDRYEPILRYSYTTTAPHLKVWNSYRMTYGKKSVEEHWTENAGMIVERLGALHRRYHCSPGWASPPDFRFTFEVTVEPTDSSLSRPT